MFYSIISYMNFGKSYYFFLCEINFDSYKLTVGKAKNGINTGQK